MLKEQYFHGICITGGIRLSNSQLYSLVRPFEVFSTVRGEFCTPRDESKSTGEITFLAYRFLLSLSLFFLSFFFFFFVLPSARNEGISPVLLRVEEAPARVIAR